MQSEPDSPVATAPPKGLPPVVPPSGGFIAQLFLVPGLIVTAVVLLLLVFNWYLNGSRSPEQFLNNLDNTNPEVRWRAASDLAQILLRDERLASDPRFALSVNERLLTTFDAVGPAEKALAERLSNLPDEERRRAREALKDERTYLVYLMGCVSAFKVPVGASMLKEIAENQGAMEPEALAERRQEALYDLANLGEKSKGFDRLPPERQAAILAELEDEAAGAGRSALEHSIIRSHWAQECLEMLRSRREGHPRLLGLDVTLEHCAGDVHPSVRKMTAFACNFWEGSAEENGRIDDFLTTLANDDGRTPEGSDPVQALEVRYNATVAQARRGSDRVQLKLLQEMLDEQQLARTFRVKPKEGEPGGSKVDEAAVRLTLINALKAIAELHRRQPDRDLSPLVPALRQLKQSSTLEFRTETAKTLSALGQQ
jgi:hypothetical protein